MSLGACGACARPLVIRNIDAYWLTDHSDPVAWARPVCPHILCGCVHVCPCQAPCRPRRVPLVPAGLARGCIVCGTYPSFLVCTSCVGAVADRVTVGELDTDLEHYAVGNKSLVLYNVYMALKSLTTDAAVEDRISRVWREQCDDAVPVLNNSFRGLIYNEVIGALRDSPRLKVTSDGCVVHMRTWLRVCQTTTSQALEDVLTPAQAHDLCTAQAHPDLINHATRQLLPRPQPVAPVSGTAAERRLAHQKSVFAAIPAVLGMPVDEALAQVGLDCLRHWYATQQVRLVDHLDSNMVARIVRGRPPRTNETARARLLRIHQEAMARQANSTPSKEPPARARTASAQKEG